ncbi:hypothetical protein [Mycobacterium paragordonae]|uniref:Uncharacterized protein n=1 Tax=Mycobacterium paragordonae TaxID=1389713 RepID=A0AAJ1S2J6_9MYCO|nr:hypothetical protein [Mycobacterium paragordonae]MDP7733674.1 hypothetical protein [Mycobacterium paragordonae]
MHYRVSALIESDKDEGDFVLYTEGVLAKEFRTADVIDLSVYEVSL